MPCHSARIPINRPLCTKSSASLCSLVATGDGGGGVIGVCDLVHPFRRFYIYGGSFVMSIVRRHHLVRKLGICVTSHPLGRGNGRGSRARCGQTSGRVARVVVVESRWLDEVVGKRGKSLEEATGDNRTDDQNDKEDEHGEVEDGVADDAAPAQLRLLERVDGRTDLATARELAHVAHRMLDGMKTYLGRSQNNIMEWNLSTNGMRRGGSMRNSRMCPSAKSAAK